MTKGFMEQPQGNDRLLGRFTNTPGFSRQLKVETCSALQALEANNGFLRRFGEYFAGLAERVFPGEGAYTEPLFPTDADRLIRLVREAEELMQGSAKNSKRTRDFLGQFPEAMVVNMGLLSKNRDLWQKMVQEIFMG